MQKAEKVFYFVAQTGSITERPASVSNFYQYEIPDTPANREWVQKAIDASFLGMIDYPGDFLTELNRKFGPKGI